MGLQGVRHDWATFTFTWRDYTLTYTLFYLVYLQILKCYLCIHKYIYMYKYICTVSDYISSFNTKPLLSQNNKWRAYILNFKILKNLQGLRRESRHLKWKELGISLTKVSLTWLRGWDGMEPALALARVVGVRIGKAKYLAPSILILGLSPCLVKTVLHKCKVCLYKRVSNDLPK